jgi:hypothetical protein
MPSRIPAPGDLAPGFTVEPGQCWRMVYASRSMQGHHCDEMPSYRGRFKNGGHSWDVWACPCHLAELVDVAPIRRLA